VVVATVVDIVEVWLLLLVIAGEDTVGGLDDAFEPQPATITATERITSVRTSREATARDGRTGQTLDLYSR
jgi:hypothetical protein